MQLQHFFPLNQNNSQNKLLNNKYFLEMMDPKALLIAQPFLNEECRVIINLIKIHSCNTFIGLGCGNGLYADVVSRYCKYIGVDPFYKIERRNMKIINSRFQDINIKRKNEKFILSFLFNLVSYIEQSQIIDFLNRNSKAGDIITFSTWNTDSETAILRKEYFYSFNSAIVQESFDLEKLGITTLNHYKKYERVTLKYSTILIIYL